MERLPPNARCPLRLVCRHWRDVVDQLSAMGLRSRPKILAFGPEGFACVGDVVLPPEGGGEPLWSTDHSMPAIYGSMSMVGTCNGLVCLCDDREPGGAVMLANPSTGQSLAVPPLPLSDAAVRLLWNSTCTMTWHQTYILARHPTTGRYEAGPDARCVHGAYRLADVDGTVYWVAETEDAAKIMSFDLEDESVAPTEPLPVPAQPGDCRLTKVHGRLGVAISGDDSLTLWVLEDERWCPRYVVEAHRLRQQQPWLRRDLVVPHFAHGDHILAHRDRKMYGHKVSEAARLHDGVVQIRDNKDLDEEILSLPCLIDRMFAYVETKEPLNVYKEALVGN
ncbi:hypothetical protein VPH35_010333 [Triticum aestivum]